DWGYSPEKANDGRGSQLGLDTQQDAGAADDEHRASRPDHEAGFGNLLRRGVLGELTGVSEMIDPGHNEVTAEEQTTEQEWSFHDFLQGNVFDSAGIKDVARTVVGSAAVKTCPWSLVLLKKTSGLHSHQEQALRVLSAPDRRPISNPARLFV